MRNKRTVALIMCILCICSIGSVLAETGTSPRAQVGISLKALISTSGSTIDGRGKCTTLSGYTSTVYVYIQKFVDGAWISVSSNSGSGSATTSTTMERGYSYRVYTTCKVYDAAGILYDTDYAYSSTVSY